MSPLHLFPVASALGMVAASTAFGGPGKGESAAVFGLIVLLILVALVISKRRAIQCENQCENQCKTRQFHVPALLFAAVWFLLSYTWTSPLSKPVTKVGYATIQGPVRQVQHGQWGITATIGHYRIQMPTHEPLQLGDVVTATGIWHQRQPYPARLRALSYHRTAREVTARSFFWHHLADMPYDDALAALMLGAGRPDDRWTFKQAGLLHILTVSGLHVGIIAAAAWLFGKLFQIPHRPRSCMVIGVILLFTWMSGAAPPVLRAGIMATIFVLAGLSRRRVHPLVILSLAAWSIWCVDPTSFRQPGTQMSFAAMLGIVTLGREWMGLRQRYLPLLPWRLDRPSWCLLLRFTRKGIDGILIGLAASVAIWPVTAHWYGSITPWSALTTVMVVPLLTASLVVALFLQICLTVSALFALNPPTVVYAIAFIWAKCWEFLTYFTEKISTLPGNINETLAPSPALISAWFIWILLPWNGLGANTSVTSPLWWSLGIRYGSLIGFAVAFWQR